MGDCNAPPRNEAVVEKLDKSMGKEIEVFFPTCHKDNMSEEVFQAIRAKNIELTILAKERMMSITMMRKPIFPRKCFSAKLEPGKLNSVLLGEGCQTGAH